MDLAPSRRVVRTERTRRFLRWGRRAVYALLAVVAAVIVLAWISTDGFRSFGGSAHGRTLERMRASPHFVAGRFANAEPTVLASAGSSLAMARRWLFGGEMREPTCPVPIVTDAAQRIVRAPTSGLRITWLGHSTSLIEIDGATILTDPMWSERASPSRWVGPRRFHAPPIALGDLPHVDAVVISHEHYDHLDMATVRALASRGIAFHVPLGIGAHLAAWGVPAVQIVEHDWWDGTTLPGGVRIVSTPARHFNGRGVPWRIGALWTSWSLIGAQHRVFFSGDTGPTPEFREIAEREGPFDVALIEIGQYDRLWGEIHLGPAGALDAFAMLRARALVPIHWATFNLAFHAWSEPAESLVREAARRRVGSVYTPRLGEPIEPTREPTTSAWWRALPPDAARCP